MAPKRRASRPRAHLNSSSIERHALEVSSGRVHGGDGLPGVSTTARAHTASHLQPVADAAPHHLGAEQRRKEDLAPPIVEVDARNQQRPIPAATASAHVFTCSPIRPNPSCQVGLVLLVIMHPPEKNIARALVALRQLQRGLREARKGPSTEKGRSC
eukprot:scaffold8477_cov112-Isochrysis_galbana.AAC.12